MSFKEHVFWVLFLSALSLNLGVHIGTLGHQNPNDLINDGFHIYDRDGYEVEKFDNWTIYPSYWTVENKDKLI